MKVLVTGAFGNVGRSSLAALLSRGDEIRILEAPTPRNRRLAKRFGKGCELLFGDIRDPATVRAAVRGVDAVCHLAALIPPAADRDARLARSINVGGTAALIDAAKAEARAPRLVLASSIAVYGDRLRDFWIRTGDPLEPNADDAYGASKVEAERLLRESGLPFVILRLSYIVWKKKLACDPIMFRMPPQTKIEVCHTEDTGRAFAAAIHEEKAAGRTFDIGGGPSCRTTYRDYLDRMFALFGLRDSRRLPDSAFASCGFHCGWYADSEEAEALLGFRKKDIEDYYAEVKGETGAKRFFASLVRPLVLAGLRASSPYGKGASFQATGEARGT
jgi:nucleoside-diphosphate-sugar epimerase